MMRIPGELLEYKQWVLWRGSEVNGRISKIPISPWSGKAAGCDKPQTWSTYRHACYALRRHHCDGIGFVFTEADPFCGIDLDHCRGINGRICPEALELIKRFDSYAELSPSGTGAHILVRATLTGTGRRTDGIEMYDSGRYFTITGRHMSGTPLAIHDRQELVTDLQSELFVPLISSARPKVSNAVAMSDEEPPVMHACGHDMHVTWLIGAATLFAQHKDSWKGTLMPVFQPAEETAAGAQAMIDDKLFERFPKPDVVLGQHVMVGSAGVLSSRPGVVTSAGDSLQIRMFGRGAHGSMPQASIDPVIMTAATVLRLQTIVSRELAPDEAAVVTVGALQAGTKENVIPDEGTIKLNVRTYDEGVRKRVLAAIERIVNAEAEASGAPRKPEIVTLDRYSLVKNDPDAVKRVGDAFRQHFSPDRVQSTQPTGASEDFGSFGAEWGVPSVFWFVGGTDPDTYAKAQREGKLIELPTNHSPYFAPVIHPTLEAGVEALLSAAGAWLKQ